MNRSEPLLGPGAYKTYALRSPINTHFRTATCAEIDCKAYREGWTIPLAGLNAHDVHVARHSGRRFREVDGRFLVFEPGQPCFRAHTHKISVERPAFYFVGRGKYPLFNVRQAHRFSNGDEWVDDFATHQDKLKAVIDRG